MSRRDREHGGAMLVTLIVITAIMGGAAVLVSLQMSSGRSAGLARSSITGLYCAEAGLVAARRAVATSFNQWNAALATYPSTAEPAWLAAAIGSHDLDGDAVADFQVYLVDNDDEYPAANDKTRNNDLSVIVVSRCLRDPEAPKEVLELVEFNGGMTSYEGQAGGATGFGNRTQ